jgi:YHS domain-containing protein
MKKPNLSYGLILLTIIFVLAGLAQQQADETAIDPVCGMTVKKATAKATFDYKGQTYYFCAEGCKEAFAKNPEKYLAKPEETKDVYTCPMHPDVRSGQPGNCPKCGMPLKQEAVPQGQMTGGREKGMSGCPMMQGGKMAPGMMMRHGRMGGCCGMMGSGSSPGMACPLQSADIEIKTEKTADGVSVKISSKNTETVKKIQEHLAAGTKSCPLCCCGQKDAK